MPTDKFDLHTIDYSVQGWDSILAADMERLDDVIPSREIVTLGETVTAYQPLCFSAADSKWYKAKADGTLQPAHGLALEGGILNDVIRIHRMGVITNAGWSWASPGAPVYLDPTTAGALTQTPPASNKQVVGYALSATSMLAVVLPEIGGGGAEVPSATAEADFIVSGASPFAWVKKTLAEVLAIIMPSPGPIGETNPGTIRGKSKEIFKTASADSPLTDAECSGTIVSNYGMTDADCTIDLPPAAEGLAFVCILPTVRARFFKLHCPAAQSDKIYLLTAQAFVAGSDDGNVGVASGYATMAACSLFTTKASDGGYDWMAIPLSGIWVAS